MCAIAGFSRRGEAPVFDISDMLKRQVNRGPDGFAFVDQEQWGIGVARLRITSPAEDNTQPLWSEDGRYCFVFNGEVYNYKKLREELSNQGYRFKTESDTEVLFASFLEWGEEALVRAQGMFAGALWDSLAKSWCLFRDPAGIKPLYYSQGQDFFIFASEIKALLPYVEKEINRAQVPNYLKNRYVSDGQTLFLGINKVLPAHILRLSPGKAVEQKQYLDVRAAAEQLGPISREELANNLRESILVTAKSDVSCSSLLSGGLDSSLASQVALDHGENFDYYFFDNGYDQSERDSAQWFSQQNNLRLNTVTSGKKDYERLPDILNALEEPLGDSIVLPTSLLMERIGARHRVVLSGEGADELFGGYAHHAIFQWLKASHKLLPKASLAFLLDHLPLSLLNRVLPYPRNLSRSQYSLLAGKIRHFNLQQFKSLFWLFDEADLSKLMLRTSGFWNGSAPSTECLDDLLQAELSTWLPDYNLLRLDKLSMSFSVEARLPYLNSEVMVSAFRLPESDKADVLGQRKRALSEIAQRKLGLAPRIANRKKHPFTFKDQDAYSSSYDQFCRDFISPGFCEAFSFQPEAIEQLVSDVSFVGQKKKASLLNLAIWYEQFFR